MNSRGMTLLEVVVAVLILASLAAAAIPSYVSWRENAEYQQVARDILTGLRDARTTAVTENQTVFVEVDIDNHQMFYDTVAKTLSERVTLETRVDTAAAWSTANGGDTNKRSTTFLANGSCSNEFYIRVNEDDDLVVSIGSTATGLSRLP
ncbi:prepilin-type N-terminal cleavage/methylation domain-containing protein [Malonomonas rubra DSM 5091]|uniref:Type II secretion system protein H n=1 Tax=Malonomonas rubra DSM 5091 TaxID=1122189 RepID=A0A1M6BKW5_MALRU|nr:GspH/FimT family pseudopilin [Malonomonas rubra]SHI49430.1 prepilin-type N-terminal cleavage/methylation domain-containing protein [Malonomonas rubra DSM 5091]